MKWVGAHERKERAFFVQFILSDRNLYQGNEYTFKIDIYFFTSMEGSWIDIGCVKKKKANISLIPTGYENYIKLQ